MRPDFPTLTPLEVIFALTHADAPCLLDLRLPEDVAENPGAIPGAVPVAYDDIATQMALVGAGGAVLICHKGLKLSAGATARLLNKGVQAWRIAGGHVGWLDACLPVIELSPPTMIALPLDATPAEAASAWATLRFTAPRVELLEVPRSDLEGVAARFGATLPALNDAPGLPELAKLLSDVTASTSLFAAQLTGTGPRPSAAFPCLDAAYRGRLSAIRHDPVTPSGVLSPSEGSTA